MVIRNNNCQLKVTIMIKKTKKDYFYSQPNNLSNLVKKTLLQQAIPCLQTLIYFKLD